MFKLLTLVAALFFLGACTQIERLEWAFVDHGDMCASPDVEIVYIHYESTEALQVERATRSPTPQGAVAAFTSWQIGCICEVHLPPLDTPDYAEFKLHEDRHCHEGHYHARTAPFHDL